MSPVIFCCVLCGYGVGAVPPQLPDCWLREFRIVYSSPEGTRLSGVGVHADPGISQFSAPLEPDKDWRKVEDRGQPGQTIPVMYQWAEAQLHGYIIHEACWTLLTQFISPRPVSLDRLLQLCSSLPFPLRYGGVSWGHGYGGLAFHDHYDNYPWEDCFKTCPPDSQTCISASCDPINVPSDPLALSSQQLKSPLPAYSYWTRDCFECFPWELRELIAILLPTEDALNLRLASRSFLPIFDSQPFWLSRFQAAGDREFVFEVHKKKQSRDWRALWRAMAHPEGCGMRNRKRIWSIFQEIRGLLDLTLSPAQQLSFSELSFHSKAVVGIAADIREGPATGRYASFHEGCTVHGYQRAALPSKLSHLIVTLVEVGGFTYVSGMQFVAVTGPRVSLGYTAKGAEVVFQTPRVRGFEVAMGSRGLHALRIAYGDGMRSHWLGDPAQTPVTERLIKPASFNTLEVGYDIVYLACVTTAPSPQQNEAAPARSLHCHALWYPTVPPPHASLNEESYAGTKPANSKYSPFIWSQFGGSDGECLRHLTSISVTRLSQLSTIEFEYDTDDLTVNDRKLGRRESTDYSQATKFRIDGPGGEVVTSIEVSLERVARGGAPFIYRDGIFESLKINTSLNRSIHFLPHGKQAQDVTLKTVKIKDGTAITGLYAMQHTGMGLVGLGVISQDLNPK